MNAAQREIAMLIAYHEVAGEIDRREPGQAGFLHLFERGLPEARRAMLADYEREKDAARATLFRYVFNGEPFPAPAATVQEEEEDDDD